LWRARKWIGAANVLDSILPEKEKPLTEDDAALVVNAAVAWKLAGNTDRLKEIRDAYDKAMGATKQAAIFGVVTRDGGSSALSDHDTMMKIAGEVDMFKGFLDTYKAEAGKGS
jgi:hypothetical protein